MRPIFSKIKLNVHEKEVAINIVTKIKDEFFKRYLDSIKLDRSRKYEYKSKAEALNFLLTLVNSLSIENDLFRNMLGIECSALGKEYHEDQ